MRSPARHRAALTVLLACAFLGAAAPAHTQAERRVEVVQLSGLLDAAYERAIDRAIAVAEREGSVAVVIQVDSAGGIDGDRAARVVDRILTARVPVIAWVGPPGAQAAHASAVVVAAAHVSVMAPGTALGPVQTLDLRAGSPDQDAAGAALLRVRQIREREIGAIARGALSADAAERSGAVDLVALQLPEVLAKADGRTVSLGGADATLRTDPEDVAVRFRKTDLLGRVQHAVAQASVAYLLLLLGLVGLVFELFHPSTGPAGLTGLVGLGLGLYGVGVLGGSWLAVALIVAGVAGFCVDLRVEGLGLFTAAGLAMLVAGAVLLFRGPYIQVNGWVLWLGIASMVVFMLGAMTRVLRDLRAIARGELEVVDPHPH
ncbi:MAG TPA: hypothetical protein VM840_09070 [Actinomycetota bacterium]|nr:hypothetical protein [Actinomycetota bacterium]